MSNFKFTATVPDVPGAFESAALGVDANNKLTKNDLGKAVVLAANNNYVLAADNADLEAVAYALAPGTVNNGFAFGTVQRRFLHLEATVKGGALAVGAQVRCAAQAALGTANTNNAPHIEAGTGTVFQWRVKSLLDGTGQIDELVLIEPCTR